MCTDGRTQCRAPHIVHRRQNIKPLMHFYFQKRNWNNFKRIFKAFLKYQAKLRTVTDLIDLNRSNTRSGAGIAQSV